MSPAAQRLVARPLFLFGPSGAADLARQIGLLDRERAALA